MNEQQPINQTPETSTESITPEKTSIYKKIWDKIPQRLKDVLMRFSERKIYQNKKVFWLVTGSFGLIFLTIVLGLIFGSANTVIKPTKIKPTPSSQATISPTPEVKDALMETDDRLNALKIKINNLDVKQSRLSPPQVNFKVSF